MYPSRVYRAGEVVQEPWGYLVHPARMREMRVVLAESLPRCEADLTACLTGPRPEPASPGVEANQSSAWLVAVVVAVTVMASIGTILWIGQASAVR